MQYKCKKCEWLDSWRRLILTSIFLESVEISPVEKPAKITKYITMANVAGNQLHCTLNNLACTIICMCVLMYMYVKLYLHTASFVYSQIEAAHF